MHKGTEKTVAMRHSDTWRPACTSSRITSHLPGCLVLIGHWSHLRHMTSWRWRHRRRCLLLEQQRDNTTTTSDNARQSAQRAVRRAAIGAHAYSRRAVGATRRCANSIRCSLLTGENLGERATCATGRLLAETRGFCLEVVTSSRSDNRTRATQQRDCSTTTTNWRLTAVVDVRAPLILTATTTLISADVALIVSLSAAQPLSPSLAR